jgi:hypothetical protein
MLATGAAQAQPVEPGATVREVATGPRWQASLGAGFTRIDGAGDQPFAAIGLRRDLGGAFARLSGSWSEAKRDERVDFGQLAARTATVTAAGGWSRGRLSLDAWASYGDRAFKDVLVETIPPTTTNRRTTDGSLLAFGGGASLEAPLSQRWSLAPYAWGEWGRLVTESIERDPSGAETFRERLVESGVTGAAGVSLDHAVTPGRVGLFVSAGAVGSTNASTLSQIDPGLPGGGPAARGSGGDVWGEFGAGGAFRLSDRLTLVAAVTRTAGLEGGDYTQGAIQLRLGF